MPTQRLSSTARPVDYARVASAVRAWRTGDAPTFHNTMTAIMSDTDPSATPGFMFATIDAASRALDLVVDGGLVTEAEIIDQLREREVLLTLEQDQRD